MPRLSRLRTPRWTLWIAAAAFIAIEVFYVYLFVLDRRISRELVHGSWRAPTVILTAAGGTRREVLRLYGVDWRVTQPIPLDRLPRYVGDAFIAAEDVRFRHHLGVDPIGIVRALLTNVR